MVWSPETSNGYESAKIAAIAVPYLQGRFLDLGCGEQKVWPSAIGIDNGGTYGRGDITIDGDIADLSMFADRSLDAVFSSHALEDFERERVPTVLREWLRVLKYGGNLVLYVPSGNFYPHIGEPGCNPAHKWEPMPGDIEGMLREIVADGEYGIRLIESEERGGTNEYSLFIVAQKTEVPLWKEDIWRRNPDGKKRALVVRFGAIGDQIVTSSILPELRKQGYFVTYCSTPEGQQVVRHDPHIDEWLIQAKDFVPNEQLGPYFESLVERYDQIINLCESIEGSLLTLPGRPSHQWTPAARAKILGSVNYLERTHDIAGVPHVFHPRFYPTQTEVNEARKWSRENVGDVPVVLWGVNGSSCHKIYPYTHTVMKWLLEKTPVHIVLTADGQIGKALQDGIMDTLAEDGVDVRNVHCMAGSWSIRQALTFAQVADVVVGPETGLLNSVCMDAMPKVIYLSHSSHENLTKHWVNTTALAPDPERVPCYPCMRLHANWDWCNKNEDVKAAACAADIKPEEVFRAVAFALGAKKAA